MDIQVSQVNIQNSDFRLQTARFRMMMMLISRPLYASK